MNPYRVIEGKLPSQKELSSWSTDRWIDLIKFAEFFLEETKTAESYKVTDEKRKQLEDFLLEPNHVWAEFIYRVSCWLDKSTNRQYFYKLNSLIRISFTYLKRHPALVTDEMRQMILKHPVRLGWCLGQYKTVEVNGIPMTQRDTQVKDANKNSQTVLPSIQTKIMNSMVELADLYEVLIKSINKKELLSMEVQDKLKSLKDLSFIFPLAQKKVGPNHFTQININSNNVKDLEKAMLDYSEKKNS